LVQLTSANDRAGLAEEQAALRWLATLVARQPSPEEAFAAVTETVGPLLGADLAAMIVFPGDGTVAATTIAGWSAAGPMIPLGTRVRLDGDSVTARVFRTAASARMDSYDGVDGETAELARSLGLGTTVGAPITVEGKLWGALMVGTRCAAPMPETTEAQLAAFTELVATAISNVEVRRELQRVATEQEALRKAATLVASGASPADVFAQITASASDVFAVPFASLIRFLPDGTARMVAGCEACSAYVGMSWDVPEDDPGIARSVARTGEPRRIDDHSRVSGPVGEAARALGIGSVVGAPVVVDGAIWGVLVVGAPQAGPPLALDVGERLAGFTELVTAALVNAEAREKARSLLDEHETLRRVATLIAQDASPEAVFVAVCDEIVGLFDAEQAAVVRLEADDATLVVVGLSAAIAGLNAGMRRMTVGMRSGLGEWPTTSAACSTGRAARRDVTAQQTTGTGPIPDLIRAQGFLSTVSAPIAVDGRIWGALTISDSRRSMAADTEKRLEDFTELIATAIANREARDALAASEARARALANEQAALRRVAMLAARESSAVEVLQAVAEEAARVLGVDAIGMLRFEADETATLVAQSETPWAPLPLGTSLTLDGENVVASVHRTGQVARMDDWESASGAVAVMATELGVRSAVASPIIVEGRLWGTMVAATNRTKPLPPDTESRIVGFAELLATAISNAESREALTRLADAQAALRRVATLVAAGIEPDELFSAVSEEVVRLFTADGAGVVRFEPDGYLVTVGRSEVMRSIPVGSRQKIDETLTAGDVYRTGRTTRKDWKRDDVVNASALGELARQFLALGFISTVSAPIVVDGELWGFVGVASTQATLPPDTEKRLESFSELVATAIANANTRAELASSEARARGLANEQAALRRVATLVARGASPHELFSAVAHEVAGIIDIPVVGVQRYEADGTFTILGAAGETNFTVGSRWPVEKEGIAAMILATGRPSRKDDYSTMSGPLGTAVREDLIVSTLGVPILVEGSIWGFMIAAAKPGRPIPTDTEERLARFTELVATAVSNATARTDLLTSRARLVSTADETRRRLERDLHDGIQQWLVALALKARKAAGLPAADESLPQELSDLADDLVAVTDELREISSGIHPAILSDAGLDDAVTTLARRSAIQVDLDVSFQGRFDPTLEATVYYIVAESITNAVKHASAPTVAVCGGLRGEAIELEIRDDGAGGADPERGTGLIGLKDRVDALGGTISLASPVGAGTTIRVRLPATPRQEHRPLRPSDDAAPAASSG
jgi:GAF domain-containing protein